ncbi:hypothetical protein M101_4589, partial [Bacteroides fragilis str. 1007-1-F 
MLPFGFLNSSKYISLKYISLLNMNGLVFLKNDI